jgi:glucose-6-phosphate isomerase
MRPDHPTTDPPAATAHTPPGGWRERAALTRTRAWSRLQGLAPRYAAQSASCPSDHWDQRFDLRSAFQTDPQRAARLSWSVGGLTVDLSKQLWDADVHAALLALADERRVLDHRDAMLRGEPVNTSEQRAALHLALRAPADSAIPGAAEAQATLERMLTLAEDVRAGRMRGHRGRPLSHVLALGIGGSHLGPELAVRALAGTAAPAAAAGAPRVRFASQAGDACAAELLEGMQPDTTLVVVASKSGTTPETLLNLQAVRRWFAGAGLASDAAFAPHLVWVSAAAPPLAPAAGAVRWFALPDWVGGRFSLWSAVGLPLAMVIGAAGFRQLLAGAHAMDEHARSAPAPHNLPLQLALLDVWNRNLLGLESRCVVPYGRGLELLTPYLQQLEMESNGKSVDAEGRRLAHASAPVVWGAPGSGAQHAFFQQLHQGPDVVPVEFVAYAEPPAAGGALADAGNSCHAFLLRNALAQARALMLGSSGDGGPDAARVCPGNRPSSFILLERLDAFHLGSLLALYEHRTFFAGSLWGVNSFDQWGVELGKRIARELDGGAASGNAAAAADASTAGLLARIDGLRRRDGV